ncbi:sensor histidine kinase [Pengzhenrongella sp.]|uniref:sensor histidine kinase n=1 Tax=Pengzhenrongella sp. TaxID=2888820 RepID=UPI002F9426B5
MWNPASAADVDPLGVHPWLDHQVARRRARRVVDVAVGACVLALALGAIWHEHIPAGPALGTLALAAVVGGALLFRARWPLPVLAVTLLGVTAALVVDGATPSMMVASQIAVFSVAIHRPRRVAAVAAVVSALVLFAVARTNATGPISEARTLIVVVWTALAFAIGIAARAQRAYVTELAERIRRADETREQEARTRVVEERVRIARELHDVVAHHIAVINIHAGLARRAVGRDAATVDASLGHVQEAARTVLDELGAVLHVLRSTGDGDGDRETGTEPAPGLDRLDTLLVTFAEAGLVVRTRATGRPGEMDRACDLAAFRIVQESLTNASKHGVGQAELDVEHAAGALTIRVSNAVREHPAEHPAGDPARDPAPVGHGLIGMRERAAACGGSLTAAQEGGTFRLVAVIPYRPTAVAAAVPGTDSGSRRPACGPHGAPS